MSQGQQIALIPIPIVYKDEQEILNGNGMPHTQPGVSLLEGVLQAGQARVAVEEP